jgi:hypothetical protein
MLDARLSYAFWALRLACGVQPMVSGLARFNAGGASSRAMGVIELLAGVLVFTPATEAAARFLTVWFLLLGVHALSVRGAYDIAVTDVLLAAAAYVLARLTRLNEAVAAQGAPPTSAGPRMDEASTLAPVAGSGSLAAKSRHHAFGPRQP